MKTAPMLAVLSALSLPASVRAQYEPPADYYTSATGTGATLRAQLRAITGRNYWVPGSTTHLVRTYDAARIALQILHRDPANASNIILIYDGVSVFGGWDSGVTWNREHTWPDSLGLGGSGPDYTDLHQLRPCNPAVNSSRGNDPFGAVAPAYWDPRPSTNPYFAPGTYTPGTNDRGEMARAMFYMDVRYDGTDPQTTNLTLVNGLPGANQMGDLAQLVTWHFEDPVNTAERLRNHLVFSNTDNPSYHQGNRNPFVDRPEFVWAIFGTSPNDSTIFVGGAPAGDGSSAAAATFRVIAGTPVAPILVAVNKHGATPTTFDVSISGPFSVGGAGQGQAFVAGTQATTLTIAPLSTATPGIAAGTVTIDNTDLTSAGAGDGSADANDLITLESAVLAPSNPSLDPIIDLDSGVVASTLDPDTGVHAIAVPLHNLGFSATRAMLDIDAVSGPGGAFAVVGWTGAPVGGSPASITLSFNTAGAAPGLHSGAFIIDTSDEDVPGETHDAVALAWEITVNAPPACFGDANEDALINFADITTILANFGEPGPLGDADQNGIVNFNDITTVLALWNIGCP